MSPWVQTSSLPHGQTFFLKLSRFFGVTPNSFLKFLPLYFPPLLFFISLLLISSSTSSIFSSFQILSPPSHMTSCDYVWEPMLKVSPTHQCPRNIILRDEICPRPGWCGTQEATELQAWQLDSEHLPGRQVTVQRTGWKELGEDPPWSSWYWEPGL